MRLRLPPVLLHLLHHLLHVELLYGAGDAVCGVVQDFGEDLGVAVAADLLDHAELILTSALEIGR